MKDTRRIQEGYKKDTRRIQEWYRKDTGRIKEKHKKNIGRLKILKIQQKYLAPNLSERAGPKTLPKKSPEEKDNGKWDFKYCLKQY